MRFYYFIVLIHCLYIICLGNGSPIKKISKQFDYSDDGMISGGLTEQNPKDPVYKEMAEESLKKYLRDTASNQHHQILEVTKVTTQVVAGTMTRINFNAAPTNCQLVNSEPSNPKCVPDLSKAISCYSEIWEQLWINMKDVKVSCNPNV